MKRSCRQLTIRPARKNKDFGKISISYSPKEDKKRTPQPGFFYIELGSGSFDLI